MTTQAETEAASRALWENRNEPPVVQAKAALDAAARVRWQPKDTAPKDRQLILANAEHRWIRFGRWYDVAWYYSGTNERSQYAQVRGDLPPTHWQPLPSLPEF
jgi:hypothetical protein